MPRHILPPIERPRKHPSHYYKNKGNKPKNRIEQIVEHFRELRLRRDYDSAYERRYDRCSPKDDKGSYVLAFVLAAILSLALAVMIAVKYSL